MENLSPRPKNTQSGAQVGIGDQRLRQNTPVQAIESEKYQELSPKH